MYIYLHMSRRGVQFPCDGYILAAYPDHYAALNVPVVDAKLQGRVLISLKTSLELITDFATQLSTLHSYLQQVTTMTTGF